MNTNTTRAKKHRGQTKISYVPDKERIALAKAWQEVPKELKINAQVQGAFKTGFRLGWKAREINL